jgi:hypothetical protein
MKKESATQTPEKEFRVVIKGIRVPPEAARRINSAVQKAVLSEVAGMDLGGLSARFTGNGSTDGIQVIVERKGGLQ